jgi:glycine/D-amino acid oxidase-like deaminating enzyme
LVRQLADEYSFAIDPQGEGEIEVAHRPSRWADLQKAYAFYRDIADFPCQLWSRHELAEQGLPSPEFHGALWQGVGFGLNPLKYSLGLAEAACDQGVSLYAHSPVEAWEKGADGYHRLQTPGGVVRSPQVIIATNAYTTENLHPSVNGCVLPILSQIFTTRPLTPAEQAAQGWHTDTPIYDSRQTLYYFRILPDGRFLIGTRGDLWGTMAARDRVTEKMHQHFQRMFPAWREVEISHVWNGLLGATRALAPHVGVWPEDPTVFYALAYHGNGVAAATWSGRAAAQLATQHLRPEDLCAPFRQPLQAFPLPSLRLWYLRSACLAYQVQDEFL